MVGLGSNVDFDNTPTAFWYDGVVAGELRWNVGSRYSLGLGIRLGVSRLVFEDGKTDPSRTYFKPVFGAGILLVPASLRLGDQRKFELSVWHALMSYLDGKAEFPDSSYLRYLAGISLTYLVP